jgi:hypothetical protein
MFSRAHTSNLLQWNFIYLPLFFLGVFLFIYEFCVCLIQALVYNLMLSQYFDEHSM